MQGAQLLVLQIPRAQSRQRIGARLISLPCLIAAGAGINTGNQRQQQGPKQYPRAQPKQRTGGAVLGQPIAQGLFGRWGGVGEAGQLQLPVEAAVRGKPRLLLGHDQPIQLGPGVVGDRPLGSVADKRHPRRLPAMQAPAQAIERQQQQEGGAAPQQRRAALEGGIVAHEIAEALRHAGNHLLIRLPLVHPAVDLEPQIPGDGGVGLHQVLILALGAAQGAGQILSALLQLWVAKLIGIDPAGKGPEAQCQQDRCDQGVAETAHGLLSCTCLSTSG
ncbi:hypothetical protein D3C79_712640 [compost metagenome]